MYDGGIVEGKLGKPPFDVRASSEELLGIAHNLAIVTRFGPGLPNQAKPR
jgi:hypothetical protein